MIKTASGIKWNNRTEKADPRVTPETPDHPCFPESIVSLLSQQRWRKTKLDECGYLRVHWNFKRRMIDTPLVSNYKAWRLQSHTSDMHN